MSITRNRGEIACRHRKKAARKPTEILHTTALPPAVGRGCGAVFLILFQESRHEEQRQ